MIKRFDCKVSSELKYKDLGDLEPEDFLTPVKIEFSGVVDHNFVIDLLGIINKHKKKE